jgi:hypothetical protein
MIPRGVLRATCVSPCLLRPLSPLGRLSTPWAGCIGILNHLFFWPELYRRTGGNGIRYKEIGRKLQLAPSTIRTRLSTIYLTFDVSTKTGLSSVLQGRETVNRRAPGGTAQLKPTPLNRLFDRAVAQPVVTSRQIGYEDLRLRLPACYLPIYLLVRVLK